MAEEAWDFREMLADMGFPREAEEAVLAALRRAGYGDDDKDRFMGMAALTAALRVHEAATRGRVRPRDRAGRNDPCPCGSGRKFKKCCQGRAEEGASGALQGPPFPLDEPDLVPRIHREESFGDDMDALDRLFREEPLLSLVRFDGDAVLGFVAERVHEEEAGGGAREGEPDRLEAWVARYLREVEGEEALGDVEGVLVAAAGREGRTTPELRALALGVALAGMPGAEGETEEEDAANPLHTLVFRCTLQEAVEDQDAISGLIDRAEAFEAVRDRLLAGDSPSLAGLLEGPGGLDGLPEAARGPAAQALLALGREIRAGLLPVDLSFPSVLPCLTRWALAEKGGGPSEEEVVAIVVASAAELGPEDAELLDQLLEEWLEDNQQQADDATLERIGSVRSELSASGAPGLLGFDLLAATLCHRRVTGLAGEPAPESDAPALADSLTAAFLERYGDFLWEEGLEESARRTWRLCGLLGPLPPGVEEKLGRAALFEEEPGTPL